ncbi:hypothetical protein GCM10007111_30540 [Virgibacillus kapii]|uniref:Uncharacterized protein n=1 Tax=Virgibacillus kapii TaxID=1638645 RepID=A0ABQ2DPI5_9BACI|nr:hypothetical protein M948_00410 [Virgibacillus sp. CM-4]GGJ66420.1 hypothetical protein GCM10007111_30540 [Virgibacillus kapii]
MTELISSSRYWYCHWTGTEVAIEAADVTILGGELLLIPMAIKTSQATIKNIRQIYSGLLPITVQVYQLQLSAY